MKHSWFLLTIFIPVLVIAQTTKNVVVEHFTNTRCSICASKNPGFYTNLGNHPNVLHVTFHPSSPYSNCLLNNHNVVENDDRTKYYSLYGSTPRFVIQGEKVANSVNLNSPALFTPYLGKSSPAEVKVSQTKYGADSISVQVVMKTAASHSLPGLTLFVGLIEDTVYYNAPNGESLHHDVFRKALTDIEGDNTTLPLSIGDSLVFQYSSSANMDWDFDRIYVMAILQEELTKEVVQINVTSSDPSNSPIGIREKECKNLQIYPNPTSDFITVMQNRFISSVKILSSDGRIHFSSTYNQSIPIKIDVSSLPTGIYKVVVNSEKNVQSQTLIVK